MWEHVNETYYDLLYEETEKFIKANERDKAAKKSDIAKLISNIRETRFGKHGDGSRQLKSLLF
jgi:hypothetical protein